MSGIFDPGQLDLTPAGLYLHIPFCRSKCPYCDFYSRPDREAYIPDFVRALSQEIALYGDLMQEKPLLSTVFFGGGTPSLLTSAQLEQILTIIGDYFSLSPSVEISLEANPGEISFEKLKAFRSLGINRLSLGCQSFNDKHLKFLQRIHTASDSLRTFSEARLAGFENISLDLIFKMPGQSPEDLAQDLKRAIDLEPEHISAYSLTVERGTPLYKTVREGRVSLPGEAEDAALFLLTRQMLAEAGYEPYEISNFARPGFPCRHNLAYWQFKSYLGMGPSAHSYSADSRWWNAASLTGYLTQLAQSQLPIAGSELLTQKNSFNEKLLNGLRLSTGIALSELSRGFTGDFDFWLTTALSRWPGLSCSEGFLKISGSAILLTDEITADLFIG
ncbi:MAG: radical SAM family heme chaperone HemW [FCB group bacterium]|nr:radical SAM family heme chaperone HemW [FCB group bacterium]